MNCSTIEEEYFNICNITEQDYLCQSSQVISSLGPMWREMISCDDPNPFKIICDAISSEIYLLNQFVCDQAKESNPCTAECNILDWAEIMGIRGCIPDEDITSEIICSLFKIRGVFDCETIKTLAEFEGYEVLNCECPDETYLAEPTYNCNIQVGSPLKIPPGTVISTLNTECERLSEQNICNDCCETEEDVTSATEIICGTCQTPVNSPSCVCNPSENCSQGVSLASSQPIEVLCEPYTIYITIAGSHPCGSSFELGKSLGLPLGIRSDFSLCLIEKLKPSHVKLKYQFENDC